MNKEKNTTYKERNVQKDKNIVNYHISAPEVRVICDGENRGVMATKEAIELAMSMNLDLLLISPNANPPVAQICNVSKYLYQQIKSKVKVVKEKTKTVQLTLKMHQHDLNIKLNNVKKFIGETHRVVITMRLRRREDPNNGLTFMNNAINTLGDTINIDKPPTINGNTVSMAISPKRKAKTDVKIEATDKKTEADETIVESTETSV